MSDETGRLSKYVAVALTGIVSLTVGVGSGLLLDFFRSQSPELTYTISSAEVFSGATQKTGIVIVRVENNGRREAEDVVARISLSDGSIREQRVAGIPNVNDSVRAARDAIELRLPFLNPGEQVSFHLLLDLQDDRPPAPTIELRAKGAKGIEKSTDERSVRSNLLPLAAAVVAALASALGVFERFRRKVAPSLRASSGHAGDQRDITAYVLGVYGFLKEAEHLRNLSRKIHYWSIADGLVESWLKSGNSDEIDRGILAFSGILEYASIAFTSQDLIRVHIARLALAINKLDIARKVMSEIHDLDAFPIRIRIAHEKRLEALGTDRTP